MRRIIRILEHQPEDCGCGHEHDHHQEAGACGCGHDHGHHHGEGACGCGHEHDHHQEAGVCGCGHDHGHHHGEGACGCDHSHGGEHSRVCQSSADPVAVIQFDYKGPSGIGRKTRRAGIGFNLYAHSGELQEYKDGFVVKSIDGREDSIELTNGIKLYAGDVMGEISEEKLRRIQIRETILSHIERERQLFNRGIKVLSLFFIDEVAHYKIYDEAGQARNGIFARMFEEEYQDILDHMQRELGDQDYMEYLKAIPVAKTHAGYFSINKKGHIVNQVAGDDRKSRTSNDMDAYDLIMRNKELLLDLDPYKSPVRFLFSHSALREGWDNPNVFQICTLKQSGSDIRKRQEVGRGLRLCVNQEGERMDVGVLGAEVHDINVLTVIASESYDSFVKELQTELAEALADRPKKVTAELFTGRVVKDGSMLFCRQK